MTNINHIDPEYLDQIFPEKKLSLAQKRDVLLYSMGLPIDEIAQLANLHPDTVRKKMYASAELLLGCTEIKSLRSITLIRIFNLLMVKK